MTTPNKGAIILRANDDGTPRTWLEGRTLKHSSGYTEEPIAEYEGHPVYPADHVAKADVAEAIALSYSPGEFGGRRRVRTTFDGYKAECKIVHVNRSGHTLRVFYQDEHAMLRVVRFGAVDERG